MINRAAPLSSPCLPRSLNGSPNNKPAHRAAEASIGADRQAHLLVGISVCSHIPHTHSPSCKVRGPEAACEATTLKTLHLACEQGLHGALLPWCCPGAALVRDQHGDRSERQTTPFPPLVTDIWILLDPAAPLRPVNTRLLQVVLHRLLTQPRQRDHSPQHISVFSLQLQHFVHMTVPVLCRAGVSDTKRSLFMDSLLGRRVNWAFPKKDARGRN